MVCFNKFIEEIVIIDNSGSMNDRKASAIESFNAFLNGQKELVTDTGALMTLVFFNTTFETRYAAVPIEQIPELHNESYRCDGGTSLYDAVGSTIDEVGKRLANTAEACRPAKVIVTILTDGEENSSKRYSRTKLESMIKHQTDVYGWEFVYLSSSISAREDSAAIGIKAENSIWYDIKRGMGDAYATIATCYSSSRLDLDKH